MNKITNSINNNQHKGVFISIEGIDGSGKSTLVKNLVKKLEEQGQDVLLLREPGGTQLGENIRNVLLQPGQVVSTASELLLFNAARAQLIREVIQPALSQGKVIIVDRFVDSTYVYQSFAKGIPFEQVQLLHETFCDNLYPDITLLLDLPLSIAQQRRQVREKQSEGKGKDRIEEEGETLQEKVAVGFAFLADKFSLRIQKIDATKKPEKMVNDALICLQKFLPMRDLEKDKINDISI